MLFVFDWDGTLINSTDKIARCMQAAIDAVDLPYRSHEQSRSIIGLGLPEAVRNLFPGISADKASQLCDSYRDHFIAADQVPCDFYPGVSAVLASLRADGHILTVATGKSRSGLNRVLGNLAMSTFFDATRCADETASKPDPLMLHELMDELAIPAAETVMVGDTEFDLEMASNAGIKSIAVSYGAHPVERLLPHKPQRCIDRFSEILDWL